MLYQFQPADSLAYLGKAVKNITNYHYLMNYCLLPANVQIIGSVVFSQVSATFIGKKAVRLWAVSCTKSILFWIFVFFQINLHDGDVGWGDSADSGGLAECVRAEFGQFLLGFCTKMNDFFIVQIHR